MHRFEKNNADAGKAYILKNVCIRMKMAE